MNKIIFGDCIEFIITLSERGEMSPERFVIDTYFIQFDDAVLGGNSGDVRGIVRGTNNCRE